MQRVRLAVAFRKNCGPIIKAFVKHHESYFDPLYVNMPHADLEHPISVFLNEFLHSSILNRRKVEASDNYIGAETPFDDYHLILEMLTISDNRQKYAEQLSSVKLCMDFIEQSSELRDAYMMARMGA